MDTTIIKRLLEAVHECGSREKAASKLGISLSYLGELLRGTRQPGPKVLSALGLRKETIYKENSNDN